MTLTRRILLAAILVMPAGCIIGPSREPVSEPLDLIFIGGVHPRWAAADDTVIVVAYFVNVGPDKLRPWSRNVTADIDVELRGAIGSGFVADEAFQIYEKGWASGEVISLRHHFRDPPPQKPLSFIISTAARGDNTHYRYPCFDRNGVVDGPDECEPTIGSSYYILPATESRYHARLLDCCQWLPPSVEPWDLACVTGSASVNCTFTAWNWTNLTAAAKGQVVVYLETEGEQANLTQRIFDVPSLAPDEERTMTVELPLDNATLAALQGAGAPMVKVTLWRPELERSRSETTTALASPPDLA